MKNYIRANTFYTDGSYVVDTIEKAIDSPLTLTISDLFMPNDIIKMLDKREFWFKIASIVCSDTVNDWHELELGGPLNQCDKRERYVFSWSLQDNSFKFYTKVLRHGRFAELIWYISSHKKNGIFLDDDAKDTDEDEIMLQT
jgi:hypothetical protein